MKNFPNAFVIILYFILFAWILTFIIPKGNYQRELNTETNRNIVIANSYEQKDAPHLSVFHVLLAIPKGIADRADLIVLILILGGCFYLIEKTGALNQGLNQLITILKGKELLALIIICILFLFGGFAIAIQEEIIAMTPVLLLFGRTLGYNPSAMIYSSFGSAVVGSAFSPFNPFGVIIAQKEAEVELLSGSEFRLIVFLIASIVWIIYIIKYVSKNRVDKSVANIEAGKLSIRSKTILTLLALTFGIVTFGLIQLSWGFNEMSACFFVLALVSGSIAGFSFNKTTEVYIDGFKEMIFACIIIGLANCISIVLKEGLIVDSIIHALFAPLKNVPPNISAVLMMISHSILHFPIPSYSGQAILTMPILTPLSDLIGLSRQVTVLAYQYGAIMMDAVIPTNGALMAIIALGGIKYNQWISFIIKPTLLMLFIAALAILVAVQIGYN
ncbi:MAG: Na+/H+ antiporter NhaC family protein [Fulvivirga sp.]|uniref:YfcC family protein n=1 Tax=Fulvivirga sp. TaxID=1931237 RepID=UPI0032EBD418